MSDVHTYQRPGAPRADANTLWHWFDAAILDAIECGANAPWRMTDFLHARGFGMRYGAGRDLRRDVDKRLASLKRRGFVVFDRKARRWNRIGHATWNPANGWWFTPAVIP